MSKYFIGIDLGTTHSALSYLMQTGKAKLFSIPQVGDQGEIKQSPLLPSALYLETSPPLPWEEEGKKLWVGLGGSVLGAKIPSRFVHSSKSWLSNPHIARNEPILPLEADLKQWRLSPLQAATALLVHMKEAWDAAHPHDLMEEQSVTLTLPASFDEVARRLTLESAKNAGLENVLLIEEPQASFYHWIENNFQTLDVGSTILICDCGGGTTDFSLLEVKEGKNFERIAIGKHLLLGGDNMDEAVAHLISSNLSHIPSWTHLRAKCRELKERVLSSQESVYDFVLQGSGSKVIGGSQKCTITHDEVEQMLLEGFFPLLPWEESLKLKQGSGVRRMGLPYEVEPAITKHLAAFFKANEIEKKPLYIYFNGGAFKCEMFRRRVMQAVDLWFGNTPIRELQNHSFDFSVSLGAAYFGRQFLNEKSEIKSATARSFYLEVDGKLLTILPRGIESPFEKEFEQVFHLQPNVPVQFQIYSSSTRLKDSVGSWVEKLQEEMQPLPPLETLLKFGKLKEEKIPVYLKVSLSSLGLMELSLTSVNTENEWALQFQTVGVAKQDSTSTERLSDTTFDQEELKNLKAEIAECFIPGNETRLKSFFKPFERKIGQEKQLWAPSILRVFFDEVLKHAPKRMLSKFWGEKFWNLSGFFIRPGFGVALDDYRIARLWQLILEESKKEISHEVELQQWICFRRIAAGLSRGQQKQLCTQILPKIFDVKRNKFLPHTKKEQYAFGEALRALASFEKLDLTLKSRLGEALLKRLEEGKGNAADYWALGRLGGRHLFSATVAHVLPSQMCEQWVSRLLKMPYADSAQLSFTLLLLSRKTQCSEINLSLESIRKVQDYLHLHADDLEPLLEAESPFSYQIESRTFGEALPSALSMI